MSNVAHIDQARSDAALESEIREMNARLLSARRSDIQRIYAKAIGELIALRSPQQVALMEQRKGLR